MVHKDFHVSDVRSLAVEKIMTYGRPTKFLAYVGKLGKTQPQPTQFLWQGRRPPSPGFNFPAPCIKNWDQNTKRATQKIVFEGIHFVSEEALFFWHKDLQIHF